MPISYTNAIDEMFGIVNAAWPVAVAAAGYSYSPEIRWPGQPKPAQVPMEKAWARVSHQIVKDGQSSLGSQNGSIRYQAIGLLYVQLFFPRNDNLEKGRSFAQTIRDAFRGNASVSGAIWFDGQKVLELPQSEENNPINVVVEFAYEEISKGVLTFGVPVIPAPAGSTIHYPVETPNGVRTTFTFVGLPANRNDYCLVWNGLVQDNFIQNALQITFDVAPEVGADLFCYF